MNPLVPARRELARRDQTPARQEAQIVEGQILYAQDRPVYSVVIIDYRGNDRRQAEADIYADWRDRLPPGSLIDVVHPCPGEIVRLGGRLWFRGEELVNPGMLR